MKKNVDNQHSFFVFENTDTNSVSESA